MRNKKIPFFLIGIILVTTPYLFWFLLGEDSYVLIHDNLDSEFVYIKLLLESNDLLGLSQDSKIWATMNGIDRSFFRSGFNLTFLIFSLLPAFYAYVFQHMIVHIIGYVGMFVLLKRYFLEDNDLLVFLISVCFAFLSYYHLHGISIAGQPILLFAFLNILHGRNRPISWVIIALFPFFSFLPVTLPFFIPILLGLGAWWFYSRNVFPIEYFVAILAICILNLFAEYNLISSFFSGDVISHRVEFNKVASGHLPHIKGTISFSGWIHTLVSVFTYTHYHPGKFSLLPLWLSILVGLGFGIRYGQKVWLLLVLIVLLSVWAASHHIVAALVGDYFPVFKVFNSGRFYFILPLCSLILFSLVLKEYRWHYLSHRVIALILVGVTFVSTLRWNEEFVKNLKILFGESIDLPTYNEFFARAFFTEMKDLLGKENVEKYSFLNIGLLPSISQFNGLKTLDSYQNNYSLEYKHQFRKIIQGELEKNKKIQSYFDNWGNRCFAFSAELGMGRYMFGKHSSLTIEKLDYDLEQAKSMGAKYIISAVPILQPSSNGLIQLGSFSSPESYWRLFLYEIK